MLALGRRLGDFEIVRLLGKGGMGEVYEARQLNPARSVALKVLAPWLSANDEALARFWREAAVPAQLDHPGIVRIISTGKTDDGTAYYTMHLVRGISLSALIKKSTETLLSTAAFLATPPAETPDSARNGLRSPSAGLEVPVGEPPAGVLEAYRSDRYGFVARIGAKAARALADAHGKGFLHRDIKPSNLMIDHHDQLYLVDFGLTKALDPGAGVTQAGVIRGTPWYMSPEQARGEPVDQRSDIYSLGVTLYELATEGKGPFTANRDNSSAVIQQVKAGLRCPLRDLAPDIPHRLERVILKAMQFKPKKRFENVSELAAALEAVSGSSHSGSARSQFPPPKQGSWSQALTVAAAVLVILLGLALVWQLLNPEPKPEPHGSGKLAEDSEDPRPDYPASFPKREPDVAMPLLRNSNEPIWSWRVEGKGGFDTSKGKQLDALMLHSPPESLRTLIALDDDPKRWFEFSVELANFSGPPPEAESKARREPTLIGVFFGWRQAPKAGADRPPFFILEVDDQPIRSPNQHYPYGLARLGTSIHTPSRGAISGQFERLRPLPPGRAGDFPLAAPGPGVAWHTIKVRAVRDSLTITIDGLPPKTYKLSELQQADPALGELDPRGALGIWTRDGNGLFRKATITAIEPP